MPLFPQTFIDDLKTHADIVTVIQDYVSLKKSGATYKGLCPFHGERTPSFHVNRDKGFFHCFGCHVGGDVIKFIELHEKIGFHDAVKLLAQRFGLTVPEPEQNDEQRASTAERESLLSLHASAATWFQQQLAGPGGVRVRQQIANRGITPATVEALGLGYAPQGRDALASHLMAGGVSRALVLRSGLALEREDGTLADRFRNRLMIPIARDTGSVVAFGGRALDEGQQPKYLNSPETPIYTKSRTLYGLNASKAAIRQSGVAVLVEGYFDFAQVYQGGLQNVVASCGTALTPQQVAILRRFTSKVVISYDPDTAGQGAAARSCELLAAEGFEVNVAELPPGEDPDLFVRRHGAAEYRARLTQSRPYLEFLLERAAAQQDLKTAEGRARLVAEMVPVGARIPDAVRRQIFAEQVSGRARVPHDMVWRELQKAVGPRGPAAAAAAPLARLGHVTKAEMALLWWLVHRPDRALQALSLLQDADMDSLESRPVLDLARKLNEDKGFSSAVLIERVSSSLAALVTEAAAEREPPSLDPSSCVAEFRRLRYLRERADTQRDIDRWLRDGLGDGPAFDALLARHLELRRLIENIELAEE